MFREVVDEINKVSNDPIKSNHLTGKNNSTHSWLLKICNNKNILHIVLSTYSTSTICNMKNMLHIVFSTYSISTICNIVTYCIEYI